MWSGCLLDLGMDFLPGLMKDQMKPCPRSAPLLKARSTIRYYHTLSYNRQTSFEGPFHYQVLSYTIIQQTDFF